MPSERMEFKKKNLGFIIGTTKTRRRIRFYLLILSVWCALLDILLEIQKKEEEAKREKSEKKKTKKIIEGKSRSPPSHRPMYFAE